MLKLMLETVHNSTLTETNYSDRTTVCKQTSPGREQSDKRLCEYNAGIQGIVLWGQLINILAI